MTPEERLHQLEQESNYSGPLKGRENRLPAQSGLQSGEQMQALLAQGGQIPTNAAEGNHSGFSAERARDLLLHLDHAHISFCQVIVKRHGEIVQEGEHTITAFLQSVEQVIGR